MNIPEYEKYQETKQHGDVTFPFDIYICTIPLDFSQVLEHWHEEMEIIYIKKGNGIVTVDLTPYEVSAGSIVLVQPGQLHSIATVNHARMEYENIIFSPNLLFPKQLDICSRDFLLPLFSGKILVPTHFHPEVPHYTEIANVLKACDLLGQDKPQGYHFAIKSQLFMLFFLLDNSCRLTGPITQNNKSLERMKPVLKYVEHHYGEKITIEQIAETAACSPSHFMRIFKETFDCSFVEYLNDYRLTMAARLLNRSDLTILAVATSVGFDNLSYFNRCFKKKYGVTPGNFRKAPFTIEDNQ